MINICFITDENYLIPTMVAIQSLIKNTKNEVCVNIIVDNVYQGHLNTFKEIETQKVKINIINIKNPCENIDTDHLYVSKSAMIKFILPEIFKDLDKILYLDGDILVLDDLSQLYNTDIESHYIAAVADMAEMLSSAFEERVGVKKYFNSGIMLLNLKKMREDNIQEKLIENKKNQIHNKFMDQDVLNKTFNEKVVWLSPKYNLMKPNLKYTIKEISTFYNLSEAEISKINKKPCILHLTNKVKPWHSVKTEDYKKWGSYLNKLPESYLKSTQLSYFNLQLKMHKSKKNTQIKKITNFFISEILKLEALKIQFYIKQNKRIVLWGASLFLEEFIQKYNIKSSNIIGIIDKNPSKWGRKIGKYTVFPPDKIPELNIEAVLLTVKNQHKEIHKDLEKYLQKHYPDIKLLADPFKTI